MYVVDLQWVRKERMDKPAVLTCMHRRCANYEPQASSYCQPLCEERDKKMSNNDSQEEKYTKLYSRAKLLVQDMTSEQLIDHIEQLEDIAFTAKINLRAAHDKKREDDAKKRSKEWITTSERPDQSVTDAISNVKVRAQRLSKLDKMRNQLRAAGIDEDTIKEMMKSMEARATEKQVKAITFQSPSGEKQKEIIIFEKPKDEDNQPFDLSNLTFEG